MGDIGTVLFFALLIGGSPVWDVVSFAFKQLPQVGSDSLEIFLSELSLSPRDASLVRNRAIRYWKPLLTLVDQGVLLILCILSCIFVYLSNESYNHQQHDVAGQQITVTVASVVAALLLVRHEKNFFVTKFWAVAVLSQAAADWRRR